ncbi:MAG: hypothetical protein NT051_00950, partial [Candidatus Micrarchaeota archaeon]|nr:hypothetical protein [Candidatus Micrarchaeota archaeon]
MHVGNIRVTEDKTVEWLDKNFLLVLSEKDKEFISGLQMMLLSPDNSAIARTVAEYLCSFENNSKVDSKALASSLEKSFSENGIDSTSSVVSTIGSAVTEMGGNIPLNVTLLAKNALALERMAARAGFSNLLEAFYS